jgi:hypothetical protein
MNQFWIVPLLFLSTHKAVASDTPRSRNIKPEESSLNGQSFESRAGQTAQFTIGMGHITPFIGAKARASAFIDRNHLVYVDYSGGTDSGESFYHITSVNVTNSRQLSAGYKAFLSNSYYWEASVFHRELTRRGRYNNRNGIFTGEALGLEFLVGHQWQWELFTLGCDWLGLHVPVRAYGEKNRDKETLVIPDEEVEFERQTMRFRTDNQEIRIVFFGLYAGLSF